MSRLPNPLLAEVRAASARLQAQTKAQNHAATQPGDFTAASLRAQADSKEASAVQLLREYERRCIANPQSRLSAPVVALWEGHWALLEKARDLRRMADEAETSNTPHPALNTATHRVTAGV